MNGRPVLVIVGQLAVAAAGVFQLIALQWYCIAWGGIGALKYLADGSLFAIACAIWILGAAWIGVGLFGACHGLWAFFHRENAQLLSRTRRLLVVNAVVCGLGGALLVMLKRGLEGIEG